MEKNYVGSQIFSTDTVSICVSPDVQNISEKSLLTAKREKYVITWTLAFSNADMPPLFVSVAILLGNKAEATLILLTSRLATKWPKPYSSKCVYVQSKFSIPMVQSTY